MLVIIFIRGLLYLSYSKYNPTSGLLQILAAFRLAKLLNVYWW